MKGFFRKVFMKKIYLAISSNSYCHVIKQMKKLFENLFHAFMKILPILWINENRVLDSYLLNQ